LMTYYKWWLDRNDRKFKIVIFLIL
jgi:hypothetical protein